MDWKPEVILEGLGGFSESAFWREMSRHVDRAMARRIAEKVTGVSVSKAVIRKRMKILLVPLEQHRFPRQIDADLLEAIAFVLQDYGEETSQQERLSYVYPASLWLWRQWTIGGTNIYEASSMAIIVENCTKLGMRPTLEGLKYVLYLASLSTEKCFDDPFYPAYYAASRLLGSSLISHDVWDDNELLSQMTPSDMLLNAPDGRSAMAIWRRAAGQISKREEGSAVTAKSILEQL